MYEACIAVFADADVAVVAAAVADYTPLHTEEQKIKKTSEAFFPGVITYQGHF